jgi:signal transduction histidine kinase
MTSDSAHPAAGQPAAPGIRKLVRYEQVRLVYDYLPVSQLVTVINAIVLVAVQSAVIKTSVLVAWLYAVCMVALLRILSGIAFRRTTPQAGDMAIWRFYAILGAAASGVVWGAAAVVLFPPDYEAQQVFIAFVLGGMVAGSVSTLSPLFPAFAALTLVPMMLRFSLEHQLIHYAMGWLTLVFLGAVLVIAWRSHRSLADMLALRFENTGLIGQLLAAQEKLKRSHDDLEMRVEERTQELSRTNAELERFAYIASHDLQEPLRNAANFALLLEERYRERLDADGREFLGYIVSGMKQMRQLVDGLLLHSRLGRPPQLAPTDCEALLRRVLSTFAMAIAESGATVTRDPMPIVQADAERLGQVFGNLLSNALKFRGEAAPVVHFGVEARGDGWLFSVRDNGIGIDPRYAGQIFEMFERLHGQSQYPGSGMGLAICRKIVENHHGRIWFDSRDGAGATFFFSLPRAGGGQCGDRGCAAPDRDSAGRGQSG